MYMHMYRVTQAGGRGPEQIVGLHGTYAEASAQAVRLNGDASPDTEGFTFFADADPVLVTVSSID